MVASQATHLGVRHLGAAAGLRAQATHLGLAAHSELSHPPRGRSRTSGSGHSLRSRRRTSGSGHSPRSRRRFGLRPLTSVSQQNFGLRHSPRSRSEPRAQAIHRESRGMANSCRSPQSRSGLGLRPFTSDSQRNAELRSFTSDSQRLRPIDGQPRHGRKRFPPRGMQHSRLHEGRGTTFFPRRSPTPLSSTRRSSAALPSYRRSASLWAQAFSPQGHAALSSARRSWHHIRPTKVADTTFVYEKVVGSASVQSTVSLVMGASVFPPGGIQHAQPRQGRRQHLRLHKDRRQQFLLHEGGRQHGLHESRRHHARLAPQGLAAHAATPRSPAPVRYSIVMPARSSTRGATQRDCGLGHVTRESRKIAAGQRGAAAGLQAQAPTRESRTRRQKTKHTHAGSKAAHTGVAARLRAQTRDPRVPTRLCGVRGVAAGLRARLRDPRVPKDYR